MKVHDEVTGEEVTVTKNTQIFAKLFYEELDKNHWGDIEPHLFDYVARGNFENNDSIDLAIRLELALKKYEKNGIKLYES